MVTAVRFFEVDLVRAALLVARTDFRFHVVLRLLMRGRCFVDCLVNRAQNLELAVRLGRPSGLAAAFHKPDSLLVNLHLVSVLRLAQVTRCERTRQLLLIRFDLIGLCNNDFLLCLLLLIQFVLLNLS